ncbi:YciI family protein [Nocardioides sp. NBC_00163]|uniref:YciI family protein n=1 Tax=Nocardioides sp. NBC_00163 TaxID=2975999 RepID=UPI0032524034
MTRYMVLLPANEASWAESTPEEKAAGYEVHGRFAKLLAERGHKVTGGAELHHSSKAKTLRTTGDGVAVTDGPFAETVEQVTGFYLIDTDDLEDMLECCKVLADRETAIEVREVVEHGEVSA